MTTAKKVLLTSVCRPFGESEGDASSVGYELLHRQVTRAQGIFSPRALHVHFSLDYIAENLDAPTVVLQYPSRRELIRELKKGYDYVGVSFIMAVFHKMKDTVALIRRYSPRSKIVLGGYGAILGDDLLSPYADAICREEGVGFFRKLLGEPELPKPYRHPHLVNDLKIFSIPVSRTAKVLAGLGCPNGCDFCCTSHFFKRRHIKLLPEGKDIFHVVKRHLEEDPDVVFLVIDEDFLLNKSRAMEFRDCVLRSGLQPSIFVFSSIKAISQYTVEEILEMGIDGFWVGYEGTRSGYAKQQGRPVDEVFTEFREHGITILASMIVGFDYQDRAVVAEELAGLMRLKPAFAQFLIYGPVPGTPFYDRVIRENRLRDDYKDEPEKFFRRADGFTTMMKHPTLTPEQIEAIQEWCFREDFERLGPSIFRVIEAWLLGYRKLKDSPNPVLRRKSAYYAREIRKSYPIFLAGRLLGPNKSVRAWISDLARAAYGELGPPNWKETSASWGALAMALWTWFTLKLNLFQHPRLTRTEYRMTRDSSLRRWEPLARLAQDPALKLLMERNSVSPWVTLRLEGPLDPVFGATLGHGIDQVLRRTQDRLLLDLTAMKLEEGGSLRPLSEPLDPHRSRVRLILPSGSDAHPELKDLAGRFHSTSSSLLS